MRTLWPTLGVLLVSCAHAATSTDTIRSEPVRSFTQAEQLPGELRARAQVDDAGLTLTVEETQTCRVSSFDEVIEESTVQPTSSAAFGPSFSAGVAGTLASAAFWGVSLLASAEPDRSIIDQQGRYGAAPKSSWQAASVVSACIGIPALVVSAVLAVQQRPVKQTKTISVLKSQQDTVCHPKPFRGRVTTQVKDTSWAIESNASGSFQLPAAALGPLQSSRAALALFVGPRQALFDADSMRVIEGFIAAQRQTPAPVVTDPTRSTTSVGPAKTYLLGGEHDDLSRLLALPPKSSAEVQFVGVVESIDPNQTVTVRVSGVLVTVAATHTPTLNIGQRVQGKGRATVTSDAKGHPKVSIVATTIEAAIQ
jgi:hypothetical protein